MGQKYRQLTTGERNHLYALSKAKMPMTEIANQFNHSRTTLYRELARNTGRRGYRPKQAQELAEQRRAEKGHRHKMTPEVIAYIDAKLGLQWSPEQIANFMKTDPDGPGTTISHETIYQHVWHEIVLAVRCTRTCVKDGRSGANGLAARSSPATNRSPANCAVNVTSPSRTTVSLPDYLSQAA